MGRKKGRRNSKRRGVRHDLVGLYKNVKAGIQAVTEIDSKSNAASTVAMIDATRNTVRVYGKLRYLELKTGVRLGKTGVKAGILIGRGYIRVIKKIYDAKKKMAILDATAGKEPRPFSVRRGPEAKLSEQSRKALSEELKRTRREAGGKLLTRNAAVPERYVETGKASAPILRNAKNYDVTNLEAKNGIKSAKKDNAFSKTSVENLEAKNGVKSKAKQQKEKLTPKERENLQGKEKADRIAEKNNVRSKNRKDNLKKKRKKKHKKDRKKKGVAANAAKRELKLLIAKQIFMEGENSGVGEAIAGFFKSVVTDWLQRLGKGALKLAAKLLLKLMAALATALLHFLLGMLLMLLPLLLPVIVVLAAVVLIVVIAATIIGLFISTSETAQDDFAVTLINNHKAAIIEEADGYVGTQYKGAEVEEVNISYRGIKSIDSNSDDMLLAYLSKATDSDKLSEDTAQAPLLNVNTSAEKRVMDAVLDEMLYIKSVTYEEKTREIVITVTPMPTPSPAPATPMPTPTLIPVPAMPQAPTAAPKLPEAPTPTVTPTPEPVTIVVIETYYVANVVIEGVRADTWIRTNGVEESVYSFLLDMFKSFGFISGGGDIVCRKYAAAALD